MLNIENVSNNLEDFNEHRGVPQISSTYEENWDRSGLTTAQKSFNNIVRIWEGSLTKSVSDSLISIHSAAKEAGVHLIGFSASKVSQIKFDKSTVFDNKSIEFLLRYFKNIHHLESIPDDEGIETILIHLIILLLYFYNIFLIILFQVGDVIVEEEDEEAVNEDRG